MSDKRFVTADGFPIEDGKAVWNYYDLVRVYPDFERSRVESECWDGWFNCYIDDSRTTHYLLNNERLSRFHPFTRVEA